MANSGGKPPHSTWVARHFLLLGFCSRLLEIERGEGARMKAAAT
jgi:hypothetical protein